MERSEGLNLSRVEKSDVISERLEQKPLAWQWAYRDSCRDRQSRWARGCSHMIDRRHVERNATRWAVGSVDRNRRMRNRMSGGVGGRRA
jgi:hypothetical protein